MRGTNNKARKTKRRASQRRATSARHAGRRLGLRAEMLMAAVEAEKGKTKVRSKGPVKSSKPKKR